MRHPCAAATVRRSGRGRERGRDKVWESACENASAKKLSGKRESTVERK